MRGLNLELLVLGLTLAWVGLVVTLGNLGWLDALATLHRWWPATLLGWGVLDLLRVRRRRQERAAGGGAA